MKLNIKALGLSTGIVWGIGIFLLTLWFLVMGYEGKTLLKLSKVYLGYSVSYLGALVGLIWGFVDGFIGGAVVAWLYNKFSKE
jgi:hypothetical protein